MAEFLIPVNDGRIAYLSSGGEASFAYDFPIFDEGDIEVFRQDTVTDTGVQLTLTTDYTVTGVDTEFGGTIVPVVTPISGQIWTLVRAVPYARNADFTQLGRFEAAAINRNLDLITMMVQQLDTRLSRASVLTEEDATVAQTIPLLSDRLSKFSAWDAAGILIAAAGSVDGVPVSTFMATMLDDLTPGDALTTLEISAFIQTMLVAADAAAALTTLEISAFIQTVLVAADAAAARATLGVGALPIRKPANESVNSAGTGTTLQNDDDLFAALAANETVHFDAFLRHHGPVAADIKFAFTVPSGATLGWAPASGLRLSVGDAIVLQNETSSSGTAVSFGVATAARMIHLTGFVVNGSTPGNLQLQWAQAVADASNTTVAQESLLYIRRVP